MKTIGLWGGDAMGRWRPRRVTVSLAGAVLLASITTVAGAQAVTSGVINACVNNVTGALRLVPSRLPAPFNAACNTSTTNPPFTETPIQWSQVGQAGPVGPQGLKGDPGPKGDLGPQGIQGI